MTVGGIDRKPAGEWLSELAVRRNSHLLEESASGFDERVEPEMPTPVVALCPHPTQLSGEEPEVGSFDEDAGGFGLGGLSGGLLLEWRSTWLALVHSASIARSWANLLRITTSSCRNKLIASLMSSSCAREPKPSSLLSDSIR